MSAAQRDSWTWEPDARVTDLPSVDLSEKSPPRPVPREWDPRTTFVVSGPVGTEAHWPGRRFANKRAARSFYKSMHGEILEEIRTPADRYAFRVRRPGSNKEHV